MKRILLRRTSYLYWNEIISILYVIFDLTNNVSDLLIILNHILIIEIMSQINFTHIYIFVKKSHVLVVFDLFIDF